MKPLNLHAEPHREARLDKRCATALGHGLRRQAWATAGASLLLLLGACGGGGGEDPGATGRAAGAQAGSQTASTQVLPSTLGGLPVLALSAQETAGLLQMREEEKLARDVYATLYADWSHQTFERIGAAEQAHMDAVALLLTRHALPDPAAATVAGQFVDPTLQGLHDALLVNGRSSLVNALKVGAEIEDVDIRDLRALKAGTDKADLLWVYDQLERGSRNHLRAFHSALQAQGATYTPKYLTQAEYDAIVGSPQERGAA